MVIDQSPIAGLVSVDLNFTGFQGLCILGLASNRSLDLFLIPSDISPRSDVRTETLQQPLHGTAPSSRLDHDNSTTGDVITDQERHSSGAILVPVVASLAWHEHCPRFRQTAPPLEAFFWLQALIQAPSLQDAVVSGSIASLSLTS